MGIWDRITGRESRNAQDPRVPLTGTAFLQFFGIETTNLPSVTIDSAMTVPAFAAGVTFLSRTLAALPLHAYRDNELGSERIKGGLQTIVNEAPNPEWSSFALRQYFWQQVFTGGRGLLWIERAGTNIRALWPMDPAHTTVAVRGGRKVYIYGQQTYASNEIIDVPFLLKSDQVTAKGPVALGAKALSVSLAMNDYAAGFFAGGGVPPLAIVGPPPANAEAMKRAHEDISRAIEFARKSNKPYVNLPPTYELKPIGFDPDKGQMVEAQRFQVEQVARLLNLPPVFVQDLTHGTFSNTEQQDLHLVKHVISHHANAFEQELNLKLFGQMNNKRYVEHSLDGVMRGDFLARMDGLARAIQTSLLTPDEARALENRQALPDGVGAKPYIQGAMVPLGTQPTKPANDDGVTDDATA